MFGIETPEWNRTRPQQKALVLDFHLDLKPALVCHVAGHPECCRVAASVALRSIEVRSPSMYPQLVQPFSIYFELSELHL